MSRLQLALNVEDLESSIDFYSKLFATRPAKVRPGYANFAVVQPPLKLVLVENPGLGGSINHLGVEVADTDTVDAEQARLAQAGFASLEERGTTCCYAKQDKFWVEGAAKDLARIDTQVRNQRLTWAVDFGPSLLSSLLRLVSRRLANVRF